VKATGLLDEKFDVREFIQVSHELLKEIAGKLKEPGMPFETVKNVYRFNVREIQYPFRADGKPAIGFEFKAFPWLIHGFFKLYLAEYRQEYAWLIPSQVLKLKYGICVDTANLCTTLLRILGFNAFTVLGVIEGGGKYYGHAWTVVEVGGVWYFLETTIHKGRPPVIRLTELPNRVQLNYVEVARFNEKEVHVDKALWEKYNLTLSYIFRGVEFG
jgi:hypothetical protein